MMKRGEERRGEERRGEERTVYRISSDLGSGENHLIEPHSNEDNLLPPISGRPSIPACTPQWRFKVLDDALYR
jgi:hypothetical protein